MTSTHKAGTLRLTAVAVLAALSHAGEAFAQSAAAQPSRVLVSPTADSTRKAQVYLVRQSSARIDSLVQRLNGLALGSEEYNRTQDTLRATLRELPRSTTVAGSAVGEFTFITTTTPRAALRFTALDVIPQGWFGFHADGFHRKWDEPSGSYVQYFEYPTVIAVEMNSPAFKAGVKTGDSLIAYNGLDLRRNSINLTRLQMPGREVSVTLRRDGEAKDVLIAVEKASAAMMAERRAAVMESMAATPRAATLAPTERALTEQLVVGRSIAATAPVPARATPRAQGFVTSGATPTGMLGAAMVDVDPNLAKSINGMEGKRGVFVTFVPPGSIADRVGLRIGDVILRVQSDDVANTAHLRVRFQQAEQNGVSKVRLVVMRAGKPVELVYDSDR